METGYPTMELNQLRSFILVASLAGFSKAAEVLHLTQPAITHQIQNLEETLGELLMERRGRSLVLTPAGEVFYEYAKQIINLTETARETVHQFSSVRGRLTIGAGTTNTIFRLPNILKSYHEAYPQVEIRIRNGDSKLISGLVYENAVDLGLVTTINVNLNLETKPLFEDQILLIAPRDFGKEQLTISELGFESLILFRSGSGFRRFLDEHFYEHGFIPKVTMEMESIEAIIQLVASGLGLAFLPEIAVIDSLKNNRLTRVKIVDWAPMVRQTLLIYRPDKYLTWPIKAFFQQLKVL
jgi:DNA-binding transcriptional LysR family regulator